MDDNIKPVKFRFIRRWHFVLPMSFSLLALTISAAAILGAQVQIRHLTKELQKATAAADKSTAAMKSSTAVDNRKSSVEITKGISVHKEDLDSADQKHAELTDEVQFLWRELQVLKSVMLTLDPAQMTNSTLNVQKGSTYIHWGKKTCNGDAETIYSGFGAGSPTFNGLKTDKLTGGGVQHLCLPPTPEWNKFDLSNDTRAFGWLYGAEYRSKHHPRMHGQNVACSACHTPRSAKIMIPALRNCPSSWTKEYEGYLMASYITGHRTTFECVDEQPEGVNGTEPTSGGLLMYNIAGQCSGRGSLNHCPPYVHARELTCVFCTK